MFCLAMKIITFPAINFCLCKKEKNMINWQTLGLENPYPRIVAAFKADPTAITSQLSVKDVAHKEAELNVVYAVSCVPSNWTEVRDVLKDANDEPVPDADGDWQLDDNSGYDLAGTGEIVQDFQLLEHHQYEGTGCLENAGICDEYWTRVEWDSVTKKIIYVEPGHLY